MRAIFLHVDAADIQAAFGERKRHRAAVGGIGVFDDKSEVGHFAYKLGDAWCSDATECADIAHARGADILPVLFVDMPDGVDHVNIARLQTFRQCRHQFGDGFGLPAGVYKTAYFLHRQPARLKFGRGFGRGLDFGLGFAHR